MPADFGGPNSGGQGPRASLNDPTVKWYESLPPDQRAIIDLIGNGQLEKNAQGGWYNPHADTGFDAFMTKFTPLATAALAGIAIGPEVFAGLGGVADTAIGTAELGATEGAITGGVGAGLTGQDVGKGVLGGAVGGGITGGLTGVGLPGDISGAVGGGTVGDVVGGVATKAIGGAITAEADKALGLGSSTGGSGTSGAGTTAGDTNVATQTLPVAATGPTLPAGGTMPGGDITVQSTATPDPSANGSSGGIDWGTVLQSIITGQPGTGPLAGVGPYLGAAGVGMAQASSANKANQQLIQPLQQAGTQWNTAATDLLKNAMSGKVDPATGKVVSTSATFGQGLIDASSPLNGIAQQAFADYASGKLPAADQLALDNQVKAEKQAVAAKLASQGVTDSSLLQGQMQQIDMQAAITKQQLLDARFQTGSNAFSQYLTGTQAGQQLVLDGQKYAVTQLNQMMQNAFGAGALGGNEISQAIDMAIQSNTALGQQVSQLMQNLMMSYAIASAKGAASTASKRSSTSTPAVPKTGGSSSSSGDPNNPGDPGAGTPVDGSGYPTSTGDPTSGITFGDPTLDPGTLPDLTTVDPGLSDWWSNP